MTGTTPLPPHHARRVLIIKLSALGDVFQALGPIQAIRNRHTDAHITILTTAPYTELLEATGYADDIWTDSRPRWYQVLQWLNLRHRLRSGGFDVVYDLQTSARSNSYFRMMSGGTGPEWSGIAAGCSHPHANPDRDSMHTIERQAEQLHMAGIAHVPFPGCGWADSLSCDLVPTRPYGLLVPGGAPHRPGKRWPAASYAAVANYMVQSGLLPVLIGTANETTIIERINRLCPKALNLCGKTSVPDLVPLARDAAVGIGNDTGPMHAFAIAGCPSIVLYSNESNPGLCAQRGPRVRILHEPDLSGLSVHDVIRAIEDVTGEGAAGLVSEDNARVVG